MEDKIKLGTKIRIARKQKGLTLKEFAEPMGFSLAYLAAIEREEKEPSERFLLLLKSIHGIDLTADNQYDKKEITHKLVKEEQAEYGYTEEEQEYAKKLIKIMRTKLEGTVLAIKQNIDAFLTTPDKQEEIKKTSDAA